MIYYGVLLFFFLDYVRPTSYLPALELLHLNSLVPLAIVVGTLFAQRKSSTVAREMPGEPSNERMMFCFLGLIVCSALFADVTERVFNVSTTVIGYVAIAWAITRQVTDLDRLKGVLKAMIVVHLVVAALNPLIFTDPDVRHYVSSGAFLGDGNDFALSINIVIPFCFFLFGEARTTRHRLVWAAALVVLILCVVLTQSRGGTVALACLGLYYWLKSEKKVASAAVAAALIALILVYAPPAYLTRMGTIGNSQEGSTQGRIQAWRGGFRMAVDHPLTGVGAGHFPIAYGTRYRPSEGIPWQTAHSIYFLVLGELGFPGLTVLLLLIGRNLAANRRMLREVTRRYPSRAVTERRLLVALSASLVAFASGGAFLSAPYYPHMYVLAGLLTASRRIAYQRSHAVQLAAPAVRVVSRDRISADWAPRRGLGGLPLPTTAVHKR